jgi:serine protease
LRHAGTKVGFSSLGPEVAVSAPAGNCINQTGTCVYSMQTTTNSGTAAPVVNDDIYTGTQITVDEVPTGPNLGTSFSAPVVSGIAGLMLAVNSNLNACQLTSRLKEGSVSFPQTSATQPTPPACHVPVGTTDVQDAECICTLDGKTCGAGMANAKGAVMAALRPIAAVSFPATVSVGQTISLNAQGSAAANGHRVLSYRWSSVGKQAVAIQNANSPVATVPVPSCGLATVQLTVTDDAGRVDTANVILDPTSVTSSAPANATGAACTVGAPKVRVEVCPSTGGIQVGGTQAFASTVANTANDAVSWQVNGTTGGNATLGTISSTGVYTAPSNGPASKEVTITAVSNADKTVSATSTLNIANPSGAHGGAMDPMTLTAEAVGLGLVFARRRRRRG